MSKEVKDKKYKDAPRYKVIVKYEDDFKDNFSNILNVMVKDIDKTIKKMLNV